MYNMKKLILLLLISGGLTAQVVVPKSTTTFSNVNAVGSMTVGGNLRVTGAETITGAATLSSSTTIGTGTVAANTSSLGILRVKSGSGFLDFGGYGSSAASAVWFNQTTPSASNYGIYGNTSTTEVNGVSNVLISAGGGTRVNVTSTGMRVGSASAPTATLDVTGTMSVSGTSTLTGAVNTTTINAGANLYFGTYGSNNFTIGGGFVNFNPSGNATTGSATQFNFVTASHYSITASTNVPAFKITGATRGFLSGAKSLQYESYLTAPTYTANAATTITTASGLHVEKPIAGSNITITNNYGISTDGNMLLGSAGLTGGNTGTVAVLSDVASTQQYCGGAISPADGATFYCGTLCYPMSSNRTGGIYFPYNGTIVGWTTTSILTGIASAETYSLQVWQNNTTATNLSTALTLTTVVNTYSGTATVSVSAGDYIETRFIAPTWATNPTGVQTNVTLWYVRRQ